MSVELAIVKAPHPQPLPASEEGGKRVGGGIGFEEFWLLAIHYEL